MIIAIQNTIGAIGRGLGIVTRNLQMWLKFTKADVLGEELVVNGDFATDSDWLEGVGWDIDTINNKATCDGTQTSTSTLTTSVGIPIKDLGVLFSFKISNYLSGTLTVTIEGTGGREFTNISGDDTYSVRIISGDNTPKIIFTASTDFEGSISNVTVKEVAQFIPDKSTNTNNAKLFTGKALSFNGNDYVGLGSISLPNTSNVTFSFWAKPIVVSGSTNYEAVFHYGKYLVWFKSNNTLRVLTALDNAVDFAISDPGIEMSRYVVTTSGTSTSLYVNGALLETKTTDALLTTADVSYIGSYADGSIYNYSGLISDFQIYNAAWDSDDAAFDYANPNNLVFNNSASSISVSNLKGYYALSEGSGSIAYDSSGEGNNGAITGATYDDKQPTIPQLGMMNWSKGSNLMTYSEDFGNNSIYVKDAGVVVGTTNNVAPNGLTSATKMDVTNNGRIYHTLAAGGNHISSLFIKGGSFNNFEIAGVKVDLIAKTVSNAAFTLEELSDGWFRYYGLNIYTRPFQIQAYPAGSYAGHTTAGNYYIYGNQINLDNLTSYIGTAGSAASNATLIQNPNEIGKDVLGNSLRLREGGFNLDGSGYAEVADSTSLNITTAITLAAWVKWSDVNDKGLVTRWTDTKKGFMLYKKTTGFAMYIGATFLNSSTITGSDWVYVVGTYDGTNIKTYIDGSPDNTLAHTGVIPYHSYTVDVGRYGDSSSSYNNLIDDVLIYDEALTAEEILNNYNVGLSKHQN